MFAARRREQARDWVYTLIEDHLRSRFFGHPAVQERLPAIEQAVVEGTLPVTTAVQTLIQAFESALQGEGKG